MKLKSLQDLYVHGLQDLYSAENQILKALPMMAQQASSPEVKSAFQTHEEQTRGQVARLERIFQSLGGNPKGVHCKGMEGLIAEGQEIMKDAKDPATRDAGMIAAAQKVEHYEIAGYGTARSYAVLLGRSEDAALLQQTLNEEEQTDRLLTQVAERSINIEAEHS